MLAVRLGLVLLALVLAGGCGGGDGEPETAEEWAGSVCASLTDWVGEIDETAQSLSGQGLDLSDDDLRGVVDRATDATDELLGDLDELGPPPATDSGQEADAELGELESELRRQIDTVERALAADPETLAFLATVAAAVSAASNEVQRTLDDLEAVGAELKKAIRDADDCDGLRERIREI